MPAAQHITPELQRWIAEQADAGQPPQVVLQAMRESGWSSKVAAQALEETLRSGGIDRTQALGLPLPTRVPEPMAADGSLVHLLDMLETPACDRAGSVHVLASLLNPRIVVLGQFLSETECDGLIALAAARLARSETVEASTGGSEVNDARTSEGMFFERAENALCARIEQRIAALLAWPLENGEGLQVLRYRANTEYKPHYDYFDPLQPGTAAVLERGGQRVASLVMYLNTPARGGATVFPDVHFNVLPIKGNAVFFSYDRPHPVTRTLHGGAPVLEGEKWVATKWLRERRFD
ncbi:MAG: 2-oxoglutarate-dependent dioxygenase [Burkholderiales bacterium PBB1]|nr:MAG: 2-oxoglutarate-dependent dioxygenase [Burkholderiales bacterium PBB1]